MTATLDITYKPIGEAMADCARQYGPPPDVEESCLLLDAAEPEPGSMFRVDPYQPLTYENALVSALRMLYPEGSAAESLAAAALVKKRIRENQARDAAFGKQGYHLVAVALDAKPGRLRVTHVLRETSKLL